MGGIGSGNRHHYDAKKTVESCIRLNVRRLACEGWLTPGQSYSWQWPWSAESKLSISVRVESAWSIRLMYRYRASAGHEWTDVNYTIQLERTPCHFGGKQVWFRCPGRGCGRRVVMLYLTGRHYLCRHCCNLAYESQREGYESRAMSRAHKLRRKLDPTGFWDEGIPDKPKGMHWRTYERLARVVGAADRKASLLWGNRLADIEVQLLKLKSK